MAPNMQKKPKPIGEGHSPVMEAVSNLHSVVDNGLLRLT